MKVCLVGVGMGNPDMLTVEAARAIESSSLLIGSGRLLQAFDDFDCEKRELVKPEDIASAITEHAREEAREAACRVVGAPSGKGECAPSQGCQRTPSRRCACVLLSGDVGLYSGATRLYEALSGHDVVAIPGVSSLSYLCARLQVPWHDAAIVSAHGREHDAAGIIQGNRKTFCLTGGATRVQDICRDLVRRGMGAVRVVAGERLSYADERIVRGTAADLADGSFDDLSVMLVENPHPVVRAFGAPSLSDADFERGAVPMTKAEVRALVIAKLRITSACTVWDVGAGTGSVSVEAALAAPHGRVFAIEKDPCAADLVRRNSSAHGACNVTVVEGEAPGALEGLPAPDRVFIGGSSGRMPEIVAEALRANPQVRLCATAVTLETLSELVSFLGALSPRETDYPRGVEIVQVSVTRAREAGAHHLMCAENPVYIVTASFGEGNAL